MFNLPLMVIAALIIGFIIYKQIDKISKNLDEQETNPDMSKYINFCDKIDDEIDRINKDIKFNNIALKDDEQKGEFLEKISLLRKELVFLQNMHSTNKNAKTWEEKIFIFLNKLENTINEYLKDSEEINEKIRENLKESFNSL